MLLESCGGGLIMRALRFVAWDLTLEAEAGFGDWGFRRWESKKDRSKSAR